MGVLSRGLAKFHQCGRLSFNNTLSDDEKASEMPLIMRCTIAKGYFA